MQQIRETGITTALVIINTVVYLGLKVWSWIGGPDYDVIMGMGGVDPQYVQMGQYWRLMTANFMHFDSGHILSNMLILVCAGVILEKALGHVKYLVLYLLAGLGGSILSYLQMLYSGGYLTEPIVSAGASGAIFGIIGALLFVVIRNKGKYETITWKGLVFMIAIELYYGIKTPGIDNWGHLGGLVAGFLLAIFLYRKERKAVDFDSENLYTSD